MQPTLVTWALVVFGVITLIPLFLAQTSMLNRPNSQAAKKLLIGKGETWRDKTHFRMSLGAAWADWLFFTPLFVAGSVGVLLGKPWAYVFFSGRPFRRRLDGLDDERDHAALHEVKGLGGTDYYALPLRFGPRTIGAAGFVVDDAKGLGDADLASSTNT